MPPNLFFCSIQGALYTAIHLRRGVVQNVCSKAAIKTAVKHRVCSRTAIKAAIHLRRGVVPAGGTLQMLCVERVSALKGAQEYVSEQAGELALRQKERLGVVKRGVVFW